MKIGIITGEFPPLPGGVGDFTRRLSEQLQGQGHEVFVLSRAGSSSAKLPLETVPGWGLRDMARLRRWERRVQPHVLNLQFQTGAYGMSPWIQALPRLLATPLVSTFHDLRVPYLFPKAGRLRGWSLRELARGSAGIICTNEDDAQALQGIARLRVIPLGSSIDVAGLDDRVRAEWRARQLGADCHTVVIGHFGFVNAYKGLDGLLPALRELRDTGMDLRLLLIGGGDNALERPEDRDYQQGIRRDIVRLGLQDMVQWTGYQRDDELARSFSAVDLMVLPFRDGASLRRSSLIAALVQGCAVITTAPRGSSAELRHGETVWLVAEPTPAALGEALRHLHAQPAQLARLRAGAKSLRRRFEWASIARETATFFQCCLGG